MEAAVVIKVAKKCSVKAVFAKLVDLRASS
jgi:hypothetical protein